ncbi:MAG TPA: succinate dehydrogenase assembly factor 2 [Thiotrichaceae bacterium]|nr:succinate dehydrogenase assembly factor 2 [Thiotrichaceae bacterium]
MSITKLPLNAIRLRCRRGMKELDILLTYYLDHHYESASEQDKLAFQALLDYEDDKLFHHMTDPSSPFNKGLVGKSFWQNKK